MKLGIISISSNLMATPKDSKQRNVFVSFFWIALLLDVLYSTIYIWIEYIQFIKNLGYVCLYITSFQFWDVLWLVHIKYKG